ncbi:hypothetical protein C8J57DRAFT_1391832 [Mycena rebaudengoi]|nr:hypothetical protein C8J57DRAFT_1391832 [Mycena rebaudengoi]
MASARTLEPTITLRSRSRSFGSTSTVTRHPTATQVSDDKKSNPRPAIALYKIFDVYLFFLTSIILLGIVYVTCIWYCAPVVFPAVPSMRRSGSKHETASTPPPPTTQVPPKLRKVPVIDRSILQRLADMETSPDPDERPYFASTHHWPPIVTRIPEMRIARKPIAPTIPDVEICGSASTPPCRFLLPLRIAEQESKAGIHFMEILKLARELNRILVLPNVGKSRIGTCFKSDFDMYYDLEKLASDLVVENDFGARSFVTQDLFRQWVDQEAPVAQMSYISAKSDPQVGFLAEESTVFSNADVSIRVGAQSSEASTLDLPNCFITKFRALRLDAHAPLYIHLKPQPLLPKPISTSILDALTRSAILDASHSHSLSSPSADPSVLVLTWDLRHPIFPSASNSATTSARHRLHYAPHLHALATALAPRAPHALVHWRMESIPPTALAYCAHALVDTLARRLPAGVRTVWFASDYPYAVHAGAHVGPAAGVDFGAGGGDGRLQQRKSGTFRDVGPLHAEAVGIFGDAFGVGGELEGWKLVELEDAIGALGGEWDAGLLEDSGVRGIVEKIIAMRATLFFGGAPRCGRASSFTRQIIDGRQEALQRTDGDSLLLQNIVDLFG